MEPQRPVAPCMGQRESGVYRMTITASQLAALSPRKVRLFACGCARSVCPLLTDPRSRAAVETAELFADGLATEDEAEIAWKNAPFVAVPGWHGHDIARLAPLTMTAEYREDLASWLTNTPACPGAALLDCIGGPWGECKRCYGKGKILDTGPYGYGPRSYEKCATCHGSGRVPVKATLCGNQFLAGSNHWACDNCRRILAWNEGTVPRMAQTIYEERRFEDMPILADALEEAGCTNAVVLSHARNPSPHSKGCWVVDLCRGVAA